MVVLPELVSGMVVGRCTEAERTAFVFRSVAMGDLALSALAYEKARVLWVETLL